jgi:non-ribosomal peptide synthetase component F
LKPGRFIDGSALTVWYSVPSVARFMKRMGDLAPARYPRLRLVKLVGEPFTVSLAQQFAAAAPNAAIVNAYGPTEATVTQLDHWFTDRDVTAGWQADVLPIGTAYGSAKLRVVDGNLVAVEPGVEGELLIGGPQVTGGYWLDPERTARSFVVPPGEAEVFYRTGDLVRRPANADRPFEFLGRIDHQIKISGHRVELGEIEAALRAASGCEDVVAMGWPMDMNIASEIVAFIAGDVDGEDIRATLKERLPYYMIPSAIHVRTSLPLNVNGKVDRQTLTAELETAA